MPASNPRNADISVVYFAIRQHRSEPLHACPRNFRPCHTQITESVEVHQSLQATIGHLCVHKVEISKQECCKVRQLVVAERDFRPSCFERFSINSPSDLYDISVRY